MLRTVPPSDRRTHSDALQTKMIVMVHDITHRRACKTVRTNLEGRTTKTELPRKAQVRSPLKGETQSHCIHVSMKQPPKESKKEHPSPECDLDFTSRAIEDVKISWPERPNSKP